MRQILRAGRITGITIHFVGRATYYAGAAAAVGVLAAQAVAWLHDGRWTPVAVTDALLRITLELPATPPRIALLTWLSDPKSWFGLHALLSLVPTAIGCGAVALIGLLCADWGRSLRARAEGGIKAAGPFHGERGFGTDTLAARFRAGGSDGAAPGAGLALRAPLPTEGFEPTPVERDVLRWLALNGAAGGANRDALRRHIGHPREEVDRALEALARRDYVIAEPAAAALAERGRLYCILQGWLSGPGRPPG